MDSITIQFDQSINVSLQVGDTVYFTDDENGEDIQLIGNVTLINQNLNSIDVNTEANLPRPVMGKSFIMFSKDNTTNINAVTGYYAAVQLKNNNTKKIELYTVGSEAFTSSY